LAVVFLGAFACWYFYSGKTLQPMTREEAELRWKLHKEESKCSGYRIKELQMTKSHIVGFRCECGYEFTQRRLRIQDAPKLDTSVECLSPGSNEAEIELESN
jgi:hypothetical protein